MPEVGKAGTAPTFRLVVGWPCRELAPLEALQIQVRECNLGCAILGKGKNLGRDLRLHA